MKFATFSHGGRTFAGLIQNNHILDLGMAFFRSFKRPFKFHDLGDFLRAGGMDLIDKVDFKNVNRDRPCTYPLREVLFKAPILRPPKVIGVGLNYRDHAAEQNLQPPPIPVLFAKAANTVIGDGDPIVIPRSISEQIDYEAELAVVMGREAFQVKKEDAMKYVFGFTALNDVTARDLQSTDPNRQWFRAKSFATFSPMGPFVVTPDELDAGHLDIQLTLNNKIMQKSNTSNLIFDIPTLIEFISSCFPLEVGDVITTGTPGGVGVFRKPPVYLKEGDTTCVAIEGIGKLTNFVR